MKYIRHFRISKKDLWPSIPQSPGIYFIISLNDRNIPKKTQRILNTDYEGILYIGKSVNLRRRLLMLCKSLQQEYKTSAHTFANKYKKNKKLQNRFPLNTLAFSYISDSKPKALESRLLLKYLNDFGELPPFNSNN